MSTPDAEVASTTAGTSDSSTNDPGNAASIAQLSKEVQVRVCLTITMTFALLDLAILILNSSR